MTAVGSGRRLPGVAAREIDTRDLERWESIRERAGAAYERAVGRGPNPDKDLLGAIAWRSVFPEPTPFDDVLRQWVNRARHERVTWREIGEAMGVSFSAAQTRQHWRNTRAAELEV